MAPAVLPDDEALRRTHQLVDFLGQIADAATRSPVRDICSDANAPDPLIWIDDLPVGLAPNLDAEGEEPLLLIRPARPVAPPTPPGEIAGYLNVDSLVKVDQEPVLEVANEATEDALQGVDEHLWEAFESWLVAWRTWAAQERVRVSHQAVYDQLETIVKTMEQRDDEYEFVLATGLVCWEMPELRVRRHLLTVPVHAMIDHHTAEIRVVPGAGRRRAEGAEFLEGLAGFRPDRGRGQQEAIATGDATFDSPALLETLHEWLGLTVATAVIVEPARPVEGETLPATARLSPSPAILMRPRSQVLIAEAYRRIARALAEPGTPVPVGLAQLVVDTEPPQRQAWLDAQGAARGDVLGDDPLFPLPTNDEQHRVLELLRTETGVVVQGPPGTGKTHTIANLVSALLAQGQRVLVTSQKDQALRVLRDKIPAEVRHLCVLLAGGSRGAAAELQHGLEAFSNAHAGANRPQLKLDAEDLANEREELRRRAAELNEEIASLREVENTSHGPVVPGHQSDLYYGPLVDIVRDVQRKASLHDWMPAVPSGAPDQPPLGRGLFLELLRLLRTLNTAIQDRRGQRIPDPDELPPAAELSQIVADISSAHATTMRHPEAPRMPPASIAPNELAKLEALIQQAQQHALRLGLLTGQGRPNPPDWVERAVRDLTSDRHVGLWGQLLDARGQAQNLQQRLQRHSLEHVVDLPPIGTEELGRANGWLRSGRALLAHVQAGGKARGLFRKKVHRDAEAFLQVVQVDGGAPESSEQLTAALDHLEAAVATSMLTRAWNQAGVSLNAHYPAALLSELADNASRLNHVEQLVSDFQQIERRLEALGTPTRLSSVDALGEVSEVITAARARHSLGEAQGRLARFQDTVSAIAATPGACPELAIVASVVAEADPHGYAMAVANLEVARREAAALHRTRQLDTALTDVHPALADLLRRTRDDVAWDERLTDVEGAWAWSIAEQFVQAQRNSGRERELFRQFAELEDQLDHITSRLVAARAMLRLLDRMSDEHSRALNSYREHMRNVGAGHGAKTREFQAAARLALRKAQDAVPAWVVPLPTLLANLDSRRDSFDIVIVDEASQVGIEHLYLLWLAPRVIVVGDDKQCTPGFGRLGELNWLFDQHTSRMPDVDHDVRTLFSHKAHLYGVLSARSGTDALVRLREHFRCMPEIIGWSSRTFYPDDSGKPGLVALRERRADDLEPLVVIPVEEGAAEGRDQRRRNPREVKAIVEALLECLSDRRYDGKTFGVVVLTGHGQIRLLDHEINAAVPVEQREERRIRVGSPADFQGDERDIVFLSMVVTQRPPAATAETNRQAYNVAASRARDQMWLFTSVALKDLNPEDLRAKLLAYMLDPPSTFGESPALDEVPTDRLCEPFDSLFEQRVFREIKARGYHVVPQHPVGSRRLDLVISGAGGRVAVECDGHRWHTSTEKQRDDARRDRDLARQGWQVMRIRESEYEFDKDRELQPLWERLKHRGIWPTNATDNRPEAAL